MNTFAYLMLFTFISKWNQDFISTFSLYCNQRTFHALARIF